MADLAARLEAAERGSRELSDEVLRACGWTTTGDPSHPVWNRPDGRPVFRSQRPSPTESVDDALALVPEDWTRGLIAWPGYDNGRLINRAVAELHHAVSSGGGPKVRGYATTPALALSAALVRATRHG